MSHDPKAPAPDEASQRGHASRMPGKPAWIASMLAGNSREQERLRLEIMQIMLLPGSVVLLPFLAWHLDARRIQRERRRPAG